MYKRATNLSTDEEHRIKILLENIYDSCDLIFYYIFKFEYGGF